MLNLCAPAIIYLFFSGTQIIIDIYKKLYNTAFIKFIIMIMVTILLNILCQRNLGIISWLIVFIPFIFLTVVVSIVLYVFGLSASTGTLNKNDLFKEPPLPGPPPPSKGQETIIVNPHPRHGLSRYIHIEGMPPPTSDSHLNPAPFVPPPICPSPPPPKKCDDPKKKEQPPKPNYCLPKPPPGGTTSPAYESFISKLSY